MSKLQELVSLDSSIVGLDFHWLDPSVAQLRARVVHAKSDLVRQIKRLFGGGKTYVDLGMPVIWARLPLVLVHARLDYCPFDIVGDGETSRESQYTTSF